MMGRSRNFKLLQLPLLLFFFLVFGNVHFVEAVQQPISKNAKKYNLSICAIFKNEAKFLKEWIEYHRLIGVDHFYLYNTGSTDLYMRTLRPYINMGAVTLMHWPEFTTDQSEDKIKFWALGTQIPAYENAAKFTAVNETKWLVFLDVDEFLVPPDSATMQEVLEKYDAYPSITLASEFYDVSSKAERLPKRKLLIETLELTSPPKQNIQKRIEKTLFKPEQYVSFTWPPYKLVFQNNQQGVVLRKREFRINRYVNRNIGYLHFYKAKQTLHVDNRMLSEDEKAELLEVGFEIEDQEHTIYRFVPELLKRMGYDPGWQEIIHQNK